MYYEDLKQGFIEYLQREPTTVYMMAEIAAPEDDDFLVEASYAMPASVPAPAEPQLEELLDSAKQSGTIGTFLRRMAHDRGLLTYKPAFFEQGQISRDYWSRLLNDELKPSKEKLLRVAILLRCDPDEAEALLDKAGFALSATILRDVAVGYCLERGIYDFAAIESLLADHDIQSLFNDRRVG
ncbi:helix-turn-helix transcriptional regulator [Paenibacillus sp. TRM 82003]|nr:helix-turn-helix transcriptional regulator [Paenibacillus sp. TRM 82003]